MNFLTPLYLLGALAIVAPIVLHLIRQTPRGEVPFSSIMFLEPSPPKVTQRSRIDHWLLLLLRAAALALLALAFARPFWRAVAEVDLGDTRQRRVLLLVDTSASLRRGPLWGEVLKKASSALASVRPNDPLAVFAFDSTPRAVLNFAESASLDSPARLALARNRLAALQPTWKGTDLGAALAEAVAVIADGADRDSKAGRVPRRIILISDLQSGSRLESLGTLVWPSDVEVELQTVALPGGNAGIETLADAPTVAGSNAGPTSAGPTARVRISNDAEAKSEAFQLGWVDVRTKAIVEPISAYVPPGTSRVFRVPVPPVDPKLPPGLLSPSTLQLVGDPYSFDNSAYIANTPATEDQVDFFGPDAPDDPNGLLYYLDRVFESTARRLVHLVVNPAELDPKKAVNLFVVASEMAPDRAGQIRQQIEAGASALVVARRAEPSPTLATLLGLPAIDWTEAPTGQDALLGEIAFDHPTFAPLAGPQFNDFTKIRFWKHRRIVDPAVVFADAQILAKFDDGTPALVEKSVGQGRVIVLTSGWNPADSQLARSSKFVPLMTSLLDRRGTVLGDPQRYLVGDRVRLSDLGLDTLGGTIEIKSPSGAVSRLDAGVEIFEATETPGVYSAQLVSAATGPPRNFAVNLDPSESRTTPLTTETLEQFKIKLAGSAEQARLDAEALRQMKTAELEGRQKLWRWIVLGAIALLIGETWLAGRVDHARLPRPAANPGTASP